MALLFIIVWCTTLVFFFLAICEIAAMWLFWPRVFQWGPCIYREVLRLQPPKSVGARFETSKGVFKVVSNGTCVFRSKLELLGFRVNTMCPIKGMLHWQDGITIAEGRIPLFMVLSAIACSIGWTLMSIIMGLQGGGFAGGLSILFVSWFAMISGFVVSGLIEIRRAKRMLKELQVQTIVDR